MNKKQTSLTSIPCKYCKKMTEVDSECGSVICGNCVPRYMREGVVKEEIQEEQPIKEKIKIVKEKKSVSSFGPSKYVKCCKCGNQKFTRDEVYQARIKKFGSEELMLKNYICRECKKK